MWYLFEMYLSTKTISSSKIALDVAGGVFCAPYLPLLQIASNVSSVRRLKQLSKDLHRHTELLLMIVQKLDILTDDDEDVDYIECDGHGSASGAERLTSVTTKKHGVQEVTVSKQ